MKLAVISCIHGNYEALNAVLSDIDAQQVDQIYCLGDLVGYGPHPNAVVELIRSLDIPTCQGGWDNEIAEGMNTCECRYPSQLAEKRGRLAHQWTNNAIHPEVRQYLAALPTTLRLDNLCFVHASPNSQCEYLLSSMQGFAALERVLATDADVLFCGHTHVPHVRNLEDGTLTVRMQQLGNASSENQFKSSLKQIVNAGSVGEPRHGRPNATYVIYDTDTAQVELREVPYEYAKTCMSILEVGLPTIFAWRLARGMEFAERVDDPTKSGSSGAFGFELK